MENLNGQEIQSVKRNNLSPLAQRIILHALIGAAVGVISFVPILWLYFNASFFIADYLGISASADAWMGVYFCALPALILSAVASIIGGEILKPKVLQLPGVVLAGLAGPLLMLLPLLLYVLL